VDRGGDGTGHRPGVDDEHDGRIEQFGDVGRRGEFPAAALTIEEAHDALYYGYVGASCTVGEEGGDHPRSREESVEVSPVAARREGMIRGVYKVWADLERGDPKTLLAERRHQARGDRRLARPRVGAGDDYAGGLYHSMPFWPL